MFLNIDLVTRPDIPLKFGRYGLDTELGQKVLKSHAPQVLLSGLGCQEDVMLFPRILESTQFSMETKLFFILFNTIREIEKEQEEWKTK